MRKIDESTAKAIYKVLVEDCGASSKDEDDFVFHQVKGCNEYRFQGLLGFGGKFWNSNNMFYVNCYNEDMNTLRQGIINNANAKLAKIRINQEKV